MDSVSGRIWFKPNPNWDLQVSTGHLKDPEALEPGNIQRTTASAGWMTQRGDDFSALTIGYGVNNTDHGARQAAFVEATRHLGLTSFFGRAEFVQVETELLLDTHTDAVAADTRNGVGAFTVGAVRDFRVPGGFEAGVGADVTFYTVPDVLKETHGSRPTSFQVFLRLRPPAGSMGRMWNMRMSAPSSHRMPVE
jgi:hypothetical protein